jgi:tetratricopeptide (TPR) repeat protein
MMPRFAFFARLLLGVLLSSACYADEIDCGPLSNSFGPFDYRTATRHDIEIVENFHFTPDVQMLKKGASSNIIGSDIAYTLRAFPNHPRALMAMATLAQRERTPKPTGSTYSIDCWFDRAIRFKPEDGQVHLIYGVVLLREGKRKDAIKELETSIELSGENANANYNLGLAYFDERNYAKSLAYAKKAYAAGFGLQGLKQKLQRAGKWVD